MTTKVNQYGWKALIGSAVGYAMDGFDLLILGFMLSAIDTGAIRFSRDLDASRCGVRRYLIWCAK